MLHIMLRSRSTSRLWNRGSLLLWSTLHMLCCHESFVYASSSSKDIVLEHLITSNKLPQHNLEANLVDAPTTLARQGLLNETDFIFDFYNLAKDPLRPSGQCPDTKPNFLTGLSSGAQGHTVTANAASFPALIGEDVSMTIGFLGPCGMNTPHTHPRATEFNYVINGQFTTGMFQENGARFVLGNATAGQATLFPRGSIHFEANLGCENVMFVAAFSNPDGGVLQVAQGLFGLPATVLDPTLGHQLTVSQVKMLHNMIPANIANGLQECISRCKIPSVSCAQRTLLLQHTHNTGYAYGIIVIALLIFYTFLHQAAKTDFGRFIQLGDRRRRFLMYAPTIGVKKRPATEKLDDKALVQDGRRMPPVAETTHVKGGLELPPRSDILLISSFWAANLVLVLWDLGAEHPHRELFQRFGWLGIWNAIGAVILSMKASPLPWLLGKSHDNLVFYHKWMAITAFLEIWIHSIWGFFAIKYQYTSHVFFWARPQTGAVIATGAFTVVIMTARSTWITKRHFELFLVVHIVGYIALLVGLWLHNSLLRWYVVVLIGLWAFDRIIRLGLLLYLRGFSKQYASLRAVPGGTLVEFARPNYWRAGSHIYINFPNCKPLQSHPYSVASIYKSERSTENKIELLIEKSPSSSSFSHSLYELVMSRQQVCDLPFNYHGPYGAAPDMRRYQKVLCFGGGSGITMPLAMTSAFLELQSKDQQLKAVTLVWSVKNLQDFTRFNVEAIAGLGANVLLYETRPEKEVSLFAYLRRAAQIMAPPKNRNRGEVTEIEEMDDLERVLQEKNQVKETVQTSVSSNPSSSTHRTVSNPRDEDGIERAINSAGYTRSAEEEDDIERAIRGLPPLPRPDSRHMSSKPASATRQSDRLYEVTDEDFQRDSDGDNDGQTSVRGGSVPSPTTRLSDLRALPSFLSNSSAAMTSISRPVTAAQIVENDCQDKEDDGFTRVEGKVDRLRSKFKISVGRPDVVVIVKDFIASAGKHDRLCVIVCGKAQLCRDVQNAVASSHAPQKIDLHVEAFG